MVEAMDKSAEASHRAAGSIAFASAAPGAHRLSVWRVRGQERLSSLFRYDVDLLTADTPLGELEQQALVASPCALGLGPHPGDVVRGVVDRLVALEPPRGAPPEATACYRLRIVPTVSLLTRAEHRRVFEHASVHDVVDQVLASYGLLRGADYDLLVGPQAPLRQLRQSRESDWSFVERWLEHEGYFYWFDHTGDAERLVVAESNADATYITDPRFFWYDDRLPDRDGGAPASRGPLSERMWGLRVTTRRTPARVAVMGVEEGRTVVLARRDVDHPTGFGTVFDHSEHDGDPERAEELARRRAEALRAEGRVIGVRASSPRLRAGHRFELAYHPAPNVDGAYLVTRSRVEVDHGVLTVAIDAIPFDVAFRPSRRTRWPASASLSPPPAVAAEHARPQGIRVELEPLHRGG